MMGYGNCDVRQAGKDNRVLKEYRCHGFKIVSVCLAYTAKMHGIIESWRYYGAHGVLMELF